MRDLAISLVFAGVLGCGARPAATSAMSGDVQAGSCITDMSCQGGGQGSLLVPTAVIGAGVVGIAAVVYVYHLVQLSARATPARRVP